MQSCSYTIPPSPDYPFFLTAKRYWSPECEERAANDDSNALTLIFLHSTSFHKEIWEPVLQTFYYLMSEKASCLPNGGKNRTKKVIVRDAWAIECPNHGESAYLNLRAWKEKPQGSQEKEIFSCQRYAEAVHRFLNILPTHQSGPKVDFRRRNLVGIGHSLGANTLLLLQGVQPAFSFSQLIVIEPMVSAEGPSHLQPLRDELVSRTLRRKDMWPSREAARITCAKRNWDPRVIDVFVKHAIYWNAELNAYTLCCSRQQEVEMYLDVEGPTKPVKLLNEVCHKTAVNIVLGDSPDLIPDHVHKALVDPNSGRRFASVTRLKNVGHLIPQECPTELAYCLIDILSLSKVFQSTRLSRL